MTTSGRPTPTPGDLVRDPVLMLAFGFGSGLVPRMPGTAGSLLAVLLFPAIAWLPLSGYLAFLAVVVVVGVAVSGRASRRLGVHDHGGIVIDEFAGLWLALAGFPATLPWLVAGFVLFRLFDIWKPWPISWLDRRLSGGVGIMVDDLVAGGFAWLILCLFREVLLPWAGF